MIANNRTKYHMFGSKIVIIKVRFLSLSMFLSLLFSSAVEYDRSTDIK